MNTYKLETDTPEMETENPFLVTQVLTTGDTLADPEQHPTRRYATEQEAMQAAQETVGPDATQVSVTYTTTSPIRFSTRHLTHKDGETRKGKWFHFPMDADIGAQNQSRSR